MTYLDPYLTYSQNFISHSVKASLLLNALHDRFLGYITNYKKDLDLVKIKMD